MAAAAILIVLIGMLSALLQARRFDPFERRILLGSYGAHMVASLLQYVVQEFYYGMTDAHGYLDSGALIARLLELDFARFAPQVLRLMIHLDSSIPFEMFGEGSATGTMSAIGGVFVYVFGPSLLVACLATSTISWQGQVWLYRAAKSRLPASDARLAAISIMLMPSVVYWSAGFDKEAFALFGLGALVFALDRLTSSGRMRYLLAAAFGGVVVGLIKPYVLFPLVLAIGAYVYVQRRQRAPRQRLEVLWIAVAAGVALGGLALMGQLFPEFGISNIAQTTAEQQGRWLQTTGGSNVNIGSEDARTLAQQVQFIPLALVNSLFRPLVFEARSPPAIAAAFESTGLAIAAAFIFWKLSVRRLRAVMSTSAALVFCAVFVLTFAIAVGLATSNLGSLSRYRVPMMPFYGILLGTFYRRVRDSSRSVEVASSVHGARG